MNNVQWTGLVGQCKQIGECFGRFIEPVGVVGYTVQRPVVIFNQQVISPNDVQIGFG